MKKSLLFIALLASFMQAQAQNVPNINQTGTLVELCAQADEEVVQDRARVLLSFVSTKQDKKSAANQVNQKMTEVLAALKAQFPAAQVTNQSYNTSPAAYDHVGKVGSWRVRQGLVIELNTVDEISNVVQMLQNQNVVIDDVQQFASNELYKQTQERLYVKAFDDVRMRLSGMAKGLGKSDLWEIVHINSTGQGACAGPYQDEHLMRRHSKSNSGMQPVADSLSVSNATFSTVQETVAVSLWVAAKMK